MSAKTVSGRAKTVSGRAKTVSGSAKTVPAVSSTSSSEETSSAPAASKTLCHVFTDSGTCSISASTAPHGMGKKEPRRAFEPKWVRRRTKQKEETQTCALKARATLLHVNCLGPSFGSF